MLVYKRFHIQLVLIWFALIDKLETASMPAHYEQLVDVLVEVPVVLDFVQLLYLHGRWALSCEGSLLRHLLYTFLLLHWFKFIINTQI